MGKKRGGYFSCLRGVAVAECGFELRGGTPGPSGHKDEGESLVSLRYARVQSRHAVEKEVKSLVAVFMAS